MGRYLDNPELKEKILFWIGERLQSRVEVAERLGCHRKLIDEEMRKDPKFAAALLQAEQDCEDALVGKIKDHPDWRASWTLLSAKYWKKWCQKPNTFSQDDMTEFACALMTTFAKYVPADKEADLNKDFKKVLEDFAKRKTKRDLQETKGAKGADVEK